MATPNQSMQREELERLIRAVTRDELDRIFKTGMMYTFEADKQIVEKQPVFQHVSVFSQSEKMVTPPVVASSVATQAVTSPAVKDQFTPASKELAFNVELCNWNLKHNDKGEFEMCRDGPNFILLKNYLATHKKNSATINGLFYWVFTDGNAVGRKEAKGGY
jgi:hypothetical protein